MPPLVVGVADPGASHVAVAGPGVGWSPPAVGVADRGALSLEVSHRKPSSSTTSGPKAASSASRRASSKSGSMRSLAQARMPAREMPLGCAARIARIVSRVRSPCRVGGRSHSTPRHGATESRRPSGGRAT